MIDIFHRFRMCEIPSLKENYMNQCSLYVDSIWTTAGDTEEYRYVVVPNRLDPTLHPAIRASYSWIIEPNIKDD